MANRNIYSEESNRILREDKFKEKLKQKHPSLILIGDYVNNTTKTKFYCKEHDNYFESSTANILTNKCCCDIGRKNRKVYNLFTKETYQERLTVVEPYLEITSEYVNAQTNIEFKCNKCGAENQIANPNNLLRGITHCGACNSSRKLVKGYTDVYTTHPQYLPYFQNEDDAKCVKYGSSKKMDLKCPICGHKKKLGIAQLISKGFACPKCGDGTSYPNRFMFNLLEQLGVDFDNEVTFEWSQNRRYDFVIGKTIIEMDGGFHKGSKFNSKEDVETIDKLKDNLAILNGYDIIRVKCYESRFELIKDSILNSKLNGILNLSNFDWVELEKQLINSNLVKKASEVFNKYKGIKSIEEMADILNIRTTKLCSLLKISSRIGMTDYDPNLSRCGFYTPKSDDSGKTIICLNDGKIYNNAFQAEKEFGFNKDSIGRVCRGERLTVKGLEFDFLETTDEIQDKKKKMKYVISKPSHSAKRIMCNELNIIFESSTEASKFLGMQNGYVSNLMSKKRKTKEGYTFKYI